MKPIVSKDSVVYFNTDCYTILNSYLEKANHSTIFILVDSNTYENCYAHFINKIEKQYTIEILEIEPGEEHKSIDTCTSIWNVLAEYGADRKSLLINLGGGVVTDLGGFIACTYMRGIKYINIPTSLLAMVDASVGGKTGVDLGYLKNMVGVISESEMVLIDTEFLNTLPVKQMCSGFAEMLKHGLIQDKEYWLKMSDLSALTTDDLGLLIYESVTIKNNIVIQDPTEQNIRKHLNFGHTLGHAIESFYLEHPEQPLLLHGEAIAIGMLMEGFLSTALYDVSREELEQMSTVILATFPKVVIEPEDRNEIMKLLVYDKKNENGIIYFTLLNTIGEAVHNCMVTEGLILQSFDYYDSL